MVVFLFLTSFALSIVVHHYVMLCYAMLCYAILCYVCCYVLCFEFLSRIASSVLRVNCYQRRFLSVFVLRVNNYGELLIIITQRHHFASAHRLHTNTVSTPHFRGSGCVHRNTELMDAGKGCDKDFSYW